MDWKSILQLTSNCITMLGLCLFVCLWSKKVMKDVKAKRELKRIEKDNKAKEYELKEKLYKDYLALQKIAKESKNEKSDKK